DPAYGLGASSCRCPGATVWGGGTEAAGRLWVGIPPPVSTSEPHPAQLEPSPRHAVRRRTAPLPSPPRGREHPPTRRPRGRPSHRRPHPPGQLEALGPLSRRPPVGHGARGLLADR